MRKAEKSKEPLKNRIIDNINDFFARFQAWLDNKKQLDENQKR